ncbi:toucan [Lycorma delicatula]|uniref:toucan n=1 Tax=Lycorma delicatula TaxID=130591 RepID=UPI003F50EAE6
MARAPGESRIPIFCHSGVKTPLTSRLSRPLVSLSSKVRAHLSGGSTSGGSSGDSKAAALSLNLPLSPCRPDLSLGQLSDASSQQEDTAVWCAVEGVRFFRKDDTPTMASTTSKHSSFELDESLGILTPDQMAESPLCDELPSLLLMSEDYQGYQGDGECSRPASPGKPNPMTDSDFFTESDADMHEELHTHTNQPPLSGDRKAQVIDGRLYGCSSQQVPAGCPSFLAAEEMDSSGVYSDTDRTPRAEPEENDDFSRAELSTLIMEQVNTIKNLVVSVPMEDEAISCDMEDSNTRPHSCDHTEVQNDNQKTPTPTQLQSPSTHQEDEPSAPATKKHKMPKRNVVSKIKTMISSSSSSSSNKEKPQEERRPRRTAVCSRWDAVMTKIAQGQAEAGSRPSLKQVKSRVFAGITAAPPARGPLPNSRKTNTQQHPPLPLKSKSRRSRTRGSESSLQTHQSGGKSRNSSRNSSISDLSKTSPHSVRSKKRESGGRSRSPQSDNSTLLAASRRPSTLPTTPPHAHTPPQRNGSAPSAAEIKAATVAASTSIRKSSSRRSLNSVNNKQTTLRDQNRLSGGGGKTPEPPPGLPPATVVSSTTTSTSTTTTTATSSTNTVSLNELSTLQHASAGFEALGVLVQYLVHNLDAFSTPRLKRDVEKMRNDWLKTKLELEEAEVTCGRLQEQLADQKKLQQEQEAHHRHQLEMYETEHQAQVAQLMRSHEESLSVMENRLQEQAKELTAQYNQELDHMRENQRLALEVAESTLVDLRRSNAEELQRVQSAASQREAELLKRLSTAESNCDELKEQSRHLMETINSDKDTKLQVTVARCRELQDEVESLRTVLELRSAELQELRRQNETLQVDAELLPPTLQKLTTAQARVEDLEVQLERKATVEKQLIQENRLLLESVHQESKQKKRLSQHNEELQWKLKQNSEVVNALVTDLSSKTNPMITISPHSHSVAANAAVSQKRSTPELLDFFTNRNSMNSPCQNHNQQCSPPQSPKVKAVVEKNDSVSWVLEIDESPEHMVNRLVRRAHSFRQASSCTPSPAHQSRTLPNPHKRQRSRTSQSMSSSTSSLRGKKPARARSFSVDSDCSDVLQKWDDDCVNMETSHVEGYSPVDRSDDNDDLIVLESVGDEVLSYIEIDAGKNSIQTEIISGEISSSESEGSVRSRRKESSAACDELLLINRDDGLRERGILPKDAAGEAMISEETSDDDVASRDSEVEDASSSGDDDSYSGSASEMANGTDEQKIKSDLKQQQQDHHNRQLEPQQQLKPLKNIGDILPINNQQLDSGSITSGMDLSWSEDGELAPSVSEG